MLHSPEREAQPREIQYYVTPDGKSPYLNWYYSLKNDKTKAVVLKRLARVRLGNLGEYRSIEQGVCELKIDLRPGYRIYFGQEGPKIIILLCGGEKGTQQKDIKKALKYWNDYKRR